MSYVYVRLTAMLLGTMTMLSAEVVTWTIACNNGSPINCSKDRCTGVVTGGPQCVATSVGHSQIDNLSGTFLHDVRFYGINDDLGGCRSCGNSDARPETSLPSLTLARYYRSRVMALSGSLGFDHFLSTDSYLRFTWSNPDGSNVTARYEDPADLSTSQEFTELVAPDTANNGILHTRVGLFRDLRLYDAAQALTASAVLATSAVITDIDGGTRTFELINLDDGPTRCGRLVQITNRAGVHLQTIAYKFAPNMPLTDMDDDRNRLWEVTTVTAADQTQATYTYDNIKRAGRFPVTAIALPNGTITTFQYSGDFLTAHHLPSRGTATFARTYDPVLQKIKTVIDDPAAEPGQQKKTVWWSGASFILPNSETIAQTEGQIFRVDNGAGETTYMAWNDAHPTVEFASNKYVWSSENGLELFELSAGAEQITAYARAPDFSLGQDPGAADFSERTLFRLDPIHQLTVGEIDSLGRSKTYDYDADTRRLLAVTDAAGFTHSATYNDRAEPLSRTDEAGRLTTYTYDALGNEISFSRGSGSEASTWQWEYEARGLTTALIDPMGNRTDFLFDGVGRLQRITEPADVSSGVRYNRELTYDAASRLITASDQAGRQTTYLYDGANRLIKRGYSDGSSEVLTYGSGATAGLLDSITDRNGVLSTYVYDAAGRRSETRIAVGRPEESVESVTYAPGSASRLTTRLLNGDTSIIAYDQQAHNIATTAIPRPGVGLVDRRTYDLAERNFAHSDAYGRWTYRVFDALDRVVRTLHELVPGAIGAPDQVRAAAIAATPAVAFSSITIGSPTLVGSTVVAGDSVTLQGAGVGGDIWAAHDQLHYFSNALASDSTLTVRLDSQTQPDQWAKTGIMLRSSTADDAIFVSLLVSMNGISVQYRNQMGGFVSWPGAMAAPGKHAPVWLQAQLLATTVHLAISDDGLAWTEIGAIPFQRNAGARIGLSVTSHNAALFSTAVFSNLSLVAGAPDAAQTTVLTNDYLASLARIPGENPGYVIEDTDYDASGLTIARHDGRAIHSTINYDSQMRITAMSEAAGTPEAATTTFIYDANGNRLHVTNPRGFVTTMSYTGRNLLATMTEANGTADAAVTAYTYSPTHQVLTSTDALGRRTVNTYATCCDRVETITDPAGFLTRLVYDPVGNRTAVTDANGLTTLTAYDGRNRQISMTNAAGETTTMAYLENATVLAEAASLGLGAGSDGSAMSVINPHLERSLTIMDGLGRTLRQVDGLGHQTSFVYDALVVDAGVTLVAMTSTDSLAHSTSLYQDGAGRTRISVDALGLHHTMGFDAMGNRVTWRDANDVGMDCVFDARNREVQCTDTAGAVTQKAYDTNNNLVAATDALLKVETYAFDARDRKIITTDRAAATTTFAYDAVSNLVNITDAEGGITLYRYDIRNLRDREIYPRGQSVRTARYYTYDPGQRLLSRAVAGVPVMGTPPATAPVANELTTYSYDAANRLTLRRYADNLNDTFSYDSASRLIAATSARYANKVARMYDAAGRLRSEILSFTNPGEAADLPVTYTYDNADRLTQLTYPDGSQVQRSYTARDELQQMSDGGISQITRGYDAGGRLGNTKYANDLSEFRSYAAADNLTAAIAIADVTNFTYSYDADKRKIQERDWQIGGNSQHFTYDDQSRVTAWNRGNGLADPAGETAAWNLSPVGDWMTFSRFPATGSATIEHRTHDPVHELMAINGVSLTYDVKGNLIHDQQAQDFAWDFENRLHTAEHLAQGHGDSAVYGYDAVGRRVKSMVTTAATTRSTYFVHAGAQEVVAITGDITAFNDPLADTEDAGAAPYSPVTQVGAHGSLLTDPTATRYNFQPNTSDTPDGWTADTGDLQPTPASRGWSLARTPVDRNHLGRPLYDSFIPLETTTWQLPLANGTHSLVIMCGDADSRAQSNHLLVNGVAVMDPTPYDGSPTLGYEIGAFDGYALTVNITSGLLTIQADVGGLDPKINFIEVAAAGTSIDAATIARVQAAAVKATHDTANPQAKLPPLVKRNLWGTYVDELVSTTVQKPRHAALRYFEHANRLYSLSAVTNAQGEVVERYTYDTYGKQTISGATGVARATSEVGNEHAFTGYHMDAESGLMYARSRMYSPLLGRFLSRDPGGRIEVSAGLSPDSDPLFASDGLLTRGTRDPLAHATSMTAEDSPLFHEILDREAYRYLGNNPANKTDPNGQSLLIVCSSPVLPVCSAAIFCSFNAGACSAGIICSGNLGACSASVVACSGTVAGACSATVGACSGSYAAACSAAVTACSAQAAGVCSATAGACSAQAVGACSATVGAGAVCSGQGGGVCSGQAAGGAVCSGQGVGACSAQAAAAAACSGQMMGVCSAQAAGASVCSGQAAGGLCSAQAGREFACSAQGFRGVCSGQATAGGNGVCSGQAGIINACSAQAGTGNGNNLCSGQVGAGSACSAQAMQGGGNTCSTSAGMTGACSAQGSGSNECSAAASATNIPCCPPKKTTRVEMATANGELILVAVDVRRADTRLEATWMGRPLDTAHCSYRIVAMHRIGSAEQCGNVLASGEWQNGLCQVESPLREPVDCCRIELMNADGHLLAASQTIPVIALPTKETVAEVVTQRQTTAHFGTAATLLLLVVSAMMALASRHRLVDSRHEK